MAEHSVESERQVEWGVRYASGRTNAVPDEDRARRLAEKFPTLTVVRREVTPWEPVDPPGGTS